MSLKRQSSIETNKPIKKVRGHGDDSTIGLPKTVSNCTTCKSDVIKNQIDMKSVIRY